MFTHISKTQVCVYHEDKKKWPKYGAKSVEISLDQNWISNSGIYVHFSHSHFQVVCSIS